MPPSSSISGFNFQKLFIVQCVRNEDSQESRGRREITEDEVTATRSGIIKVLCRGRGIRSIILYDFILYDLIISQSFPYV